MEGVPSWRAVSADIGAALGASFCVAPFIAVVDQSIIENASGRRTIVEAAKRQLGQLATEPHRYLSKPAFLLIWGVYGGTYIAANVVNSICDARKATDAQRGAAKFFGVSTVNISLNISKDSIFTRMFGDKGKAPTAGGPVAQADSRFLPDLGKARPMPKLSYACFAMRDSLTVFASFNLSPMAAAKLQENGWDETAARTAAQLFCPIAIQWLSCPLHLYGLDLFSRPATAGSLDVPNFGSLGVPGEGFPELQAFKPPSFADRLMHIRSKYLETALARSARIGPAFGVGKLLNDPLRDRLHRFTNA
jgi:hypothetical protein